MNYWQIKAAWLTRQLAMKELSAQAEKADADLAAVWEANGLDPKKQYLMKDADETVTEAEATHGE